jgi:predicted RNA-binding Zn-ribbon protein involved in translation (DUF1610 family)
MDTVTEHLRTHLTDGRWHDSCYYCRQRRLHGGTGVADHLCPVCGGTQIITALDPADSPWFPKRVRTYRCPDCTDKEPS